MVFINNLVKEKRKAQKLTQRELAKKRELLNEQLFRLKTAGTNHQSFWHINWQEFLTPILKLYSV